MSPSAGGCWLHGRLYMNNNIKKIFQLIYIRFLCICGILLTLWKKSREFSRMPHPRQVPWFVPMVPDPNAPWCMRFWFHMFGPLVGALRVLIRVYNMNTPSLRQVWALSGSAGNAWFMAQVTVSSINDFQVRHRPCQVWLKAYRQLLRSRSVGCMKYSIWFDVLKTLRPKSPTYEIW